MVQEFVLKNDDATPTGGGGDEEEEEMIGSTGSASPRRGRPARPPFSSSSSFLVDSSWRWATTTTPSSSPSSPSSLCRRHTITPSPASSMNSTSDGVAGNATSSEDHMIRSSSSSSCSIRNATIRRIFTTMMMTTTNRDKGSKTSTTTTKTTTRMFCILLLSVGLFCIGAQIVFVFSNTNMITRMKFLAPHDPHGVLDSSSSSSNSSNLAVLDDNNKNNHDDFALAYHQSFGFFHDVSSEHWKIHQRIAGEEYYSKHMYPRNPLQQLPLQVTAWYQENYDPNFSCAFERRIGGTGNGDGPKWVCDIHRLSRLAKERQRRRQTSSSMNVSRNRRNSNIRRHKKKMQHDHVRNNNNNNKTRQPLPGCVVYSVGSNGDFTFELGIQNAVGGAGVCEIHIFDPGNFGPEMPKELEATYHRWGLANETKNMTSNTVYAFENNQGNVFLSLEDTIKALGHERLETIDIFKIDCEGCEWDVYEDWLKPSLPSIQQILVEVHQAPMDKVLSFFDRLMEEGYVIFHKEPNIQYNPSCIEYGFLKLHKDFFQSSNSSKSKG